MNTTIRNRFTSRQLAVATALLAFTAVSCGREPTGYAGGGARFSQGIAFNAKFPEGFDEFKRQAQVTPGAGDLVAFTKVRIVLKNPDGTVAYDQLVDFPVGATELQLTLTVPLPAGTSASGVPLALTLDYQNAAGETVFKGGPVTVNAVPTAPGQGPPPPAQVTIPLSYTGPGSNAASVRIVPKTLSTNTGQTFNVSAQAFDAAGNVLANVPVLFNSLNPFLATVNAATGAGTAGPARGEVSIEAKLLTGQSDLAQLTIISPPSLLATVSGGGQTAPVGSTLANPVIVRVTAADGGPAPGVNVTFTAANGGSVGTPTVATDANGLASTTWRLGATVGQQTLTATAAGLSGSPQVFTATGRAIDPVRLVFVQQPPPSVGAGSEMAPAITVQAVDATGALTTAFTGNITVGFGSAVAGNAVLSGTKTAAAVAGVATFADLKVNVPGSYTLVATTSGLAGATSNAFVVVAGAANRLAFQSYPVIGASAVGIIDPITVHVRDALNNPVTNFTGAVTLSANGPSALAAGGAATPAGVTRVAPDGTGQAHALLGTTTVNAVAGVATFSDIRLTAAGAYTLTASSAGLIAATGPPFAIAAGPASVIALVSGGGQAAAGGAALASPVVVRVTDALGNGIAGITVNFTPTATHGSVTPASAVTNGAGIAQTTWTLAGTSGAKTLNVTSTGLTTLVVNATATSASGAVRTWTGATSNAFAVATNWSPAGVPGAADQLTIPITATAPVNTGTIAVGSLTLASGATLDNSGLITVNGSLDAGLPIGVRGNTRANGRARVRQVNSPANVFGAGITGNGQLTLAGAGGSTVIGIVTNQVVVSGTYAQTDFVQVASAFQIISGGTFTVNGQTLQVDGDFYTAGTGKLVMNNAIDEVLIDGNANFGGGNEHGFLTAGTLSVRRNFNATGATFSATGTHITEFDGINESTQTISFTSPVAGRGFNHVEFEEMDYKVLVGSFTAMGNVYVDSDDMQITGPGVTAKIGGDFSDATFVVYDTLGAWRVPITEFFGNGTINSQFLTTDVIVSGGTRRMAPFFNPVREGGSAARGGANPRAGVRGVSGRGIPAGVMDAGYAQINGSVTVTGAGAILDINTTELYVEGDFATASGGRLKMMSEYDRLWIGGNALFAGGSTAGLLTDGEMEVLGNFTQGGGAADAFAPAALFMVWLGDQCDPYYQVCGSELRAARATRAQARGDKLRLPQQGADRARSESERAASIRHSADSARYAALRQVQLDARRGSRERRAAVFAARGVRATALAKVNARPARTAVRGSTPAGVRRVAGPANVVDGYSFISFANPGSSSFGSLYLQGVDFELGSDLNILGRLETGGGYEFNVFSGSPRTVTSHGADVRDLIFDNVRWVLLDGADVWALDYVEFINMSPTVDQFTINRTATEMGGEIGGYNAYYWYFGTIPTTGRYVNAIDSDAIVPVMQLNMVMPQPAVHGGKVATSGGALINYWVSTFVWTGAGGNDLWGTGGNWSTGFPPGSNDDITIPSGTPFNPRVNSYGYARNLTIASGVVVQVDGSLNVYGDLTAPTLAAATAGSGYLSMEGSGTRSVSGRFAKLQVVYYNFKIADGGAQLIVDAGGFVIGGATFDVNGGELHVGGPGGTGTGEFMILNGGRLLMDNAADKVFVGTSGVQFDGAASSGDLTAGTFTVTNGLLRSGYAGVSAPPDALVATGTHTFVLAGNSTIDLASPANSSLNNLTLAVGSTTTLGNNLIVTGTLARAASGSGTTTITATANRTLTAGGLLFSSAQPTTVTRVLLTLADGTANTTFDGVTFSGYTNASAGSIFSVNRSTGPLTFNQLHFGGAGFAASGTDHFVANLGAADITILNTGPATPATGTLGTHFVKLGAGNVVW